MLIARLTAFEELDMMPAPQLRKNFPWLSLVFANASFTSTIINSERLPSIFASIEVFVITGLQL